MLLWLPMVRLAIHIGETLDPMNAQCQRDKTRDCRDFSREELARKTLVVEDQEQRKKQIHQKTAIQENTRYFNYNAALAGTYEIGREHCCHRIALRGQSAEDKETWGCRGRKIGLALENLHSELRAAYSV